MKIKHKKIYALASLFTLIFLTSAPMIKDTQALLTEPSNYDYYLKPHLSGGVFQEYRLGTSFSGYISNPEFVRTTNPTNSLYSDYNATYSWGELYVSMRFDRSTTQWQNTTGNLYYPYDTPGIGSDNTVGTISHKWSLTIGNGTASDYRLYIDTSNTPSGRNYVYTLNNILISNNVGLFYFIGDTGFLSLYLPAYSTMEFRTHTSTSSYLLDAWYLQDLGVSDAYTNGLTDNTSAYDLGFDAGYDAITAPNTLLMGFQAMVGILVNFVLMIVNLEVFGISILNVFSILVLFVGVIWILKIVRG
jgi:hypothetical protein